MMTQTKRSAVVWLIGAMVFSLAAFGWAESYEEAHETFQRADASAAFFDRCYGYAIFPTVGKGGIGIGGAHGSGRGYAQGEYVGHAVSRATRGRASGPNACASDASAASVA